MHQSYKPWHDGYADIDHTKMFLMIRRVRILVTESSGQCMQEGDNMHIHQSTNSQRVNEINII